MPMKSLSNPRQRGSALIITLLTLLVLTILGTSAVQVSILDEKMAGNLRNSNLAFQAAETALRSGETALAAMTNAQLASTNFNCSYGLYPVGDFNCDGTRDDAPIWENGNMTWSITQSVRYNGSALTEVVKTPPAYIIEQLAGVVGGGGSKGLPATVDSGYYRITARGTGGNDTAQVTVQSIFKR